MLQEILSQPTVNFPISLTTFLLVFFEALFLGYAISWIYSKRKISQDSGFQYSLWLVSPIVATLLLFIGSNLALSIGMVGSLSVIRFRTAIKDPSDLMYLFILIMIGLGAGTQNYVITFVASILMVIILLMISSKQSDFKTSDVVIIKDSRKEIFEEAIREFRLKFPKSQVRYMSSKKDHNEVSFILPFSDELSLINFKENYKIESLVILKK